MPSTQGKYDSEGNGLLFDYPKMEINKKIRLIELFGGIGSQAMALRDIGADFEHYRLVEFDKYAVQSYNAIHKTDFTTTDIRDVHGVDLGITDKDLYCYLVTYSFPCTDLSVAGKMKGMSKKDWESGDSTRSGLLWEVERILKELPKEQLPDVLLMENVPQVHADQNIIDFENWQKFLKTIGYFNFYKDLNAKDYGIPQNRERCFMVSILSDEFIEYEFPEGVKLEKVMKDFLEEEVDEKYYINSEKAQQIIKQLLDSKALEQNIITADLTIKNPKKKDIANVIMTREDRGISNVTSTGNAIIEKTKCVGGLSESKWGSKQYHQQDRVYKGDIALALPANIPEGSYKYIVAMRGRNPEHPTDRTPGLPTEQRLEVNQNGTCNTLTTVQKDNLVLEKRIQKVGQISNEGSQCGTVVSENGLFPTISAGCHGYANPHILTKVNGFYEQAIETAKKGNAKPGDIIDAFNGKVLKDGISPTITTRPEGKKTAILPCVEIKQATKDGTIKCKVGGCFDASYPDSKPRRGRVQEGGDVVPTLTASSSENINYVETVYRIRKLTPRECWRLMGYTDADFESAQEAGVSNSQLYKQAGNAIVKQVLMAIFKQMNIKCIKETV